jgi:hypothetical protein
MDTNKIIIVIAVLILFGLVLYLCNKTSPNKPLQPWTGDQLTRSFDLFRSILPREDDNMLECLISELSRKMSFKDFLAQNNKQRLQSILDVKENCMGSSGSLQPWTGDQLTRSLDLLRSILSPNMKKDKKLIECLISELSRTMSFKDFINQNDKQRIQSVLGVKGNWSSCMKKDLMEQLLSLKDPKPLSPPCVLCIIGTLEQKYSPFDISNMKTEDLKTVMKTVIMSCEPCKQLIY